MLAVALISPTLAMAVLFAALIASRILNERAMRSLTPEFKAKLVDEFSASRMVALIPIAALAALYIFSDSSGSSSFTALFPLWMLAFLLFAGGMQFYIWRRLTKAEFPKQYIKSYTLGRAIMFGALMLFVFAGRGS